MENKRSQVLNLERVQALEAWRKKTNTTLTQVNGQRKYGGPPAGWDGPPPGACCEIFISQIPRDAYEDLLIPLFSSPGPLWEFRLMMNFSGQNRGFAYGKYGSPGVATKAIRLLHGYTLEPGFHLSVRRSTEKRHLCIGDLPATTGQEDLLQMLRSLADGVEEMFLKTGPGVEGMSAIVAFSSHHAASMAKKVLVEAFKKRFALNISITWHVALKPNLDELVALNKPSKTLPPPPLKPPRHILNSCQLSAPPHRMARPPSGPQGFCRAVGGPWAPPSSSPFQGHLVSSSSAVMLTDVRQPLYEINYSHAGPDGFLYFTYKVRFPGITTTFQGRVMILPGASGAAMLEEAQRAAAQQVLQRLTKHQLAC